MSEPNIPKAAMAVYELLLPLSVDDRQRVVRGALAMLGDPVAHKTASGDDPEEEPDFSGVGPKAKKWLKKFSITSEHLEHVFHFEGDSVELLDIDVPGNTKKLQTANSYLLVGAKQYLESDTASFDDKTAVEFCKRVV